MNHRSNQPVIVIPERIFWNASQRKLVFQFLFDLCRSLYPAENPIHVLTRRTIALEAGVNDGDVHVYVMHQNARYGKLDLSLNLYCPGYRRRPPVTNLADTEVSPDLVAIARPILLSINSQFQDLCSVIWPYLQQPCYLAHIRNPVQVERFFQNVTRNGPHRPLVQVAWPISPVSRREKWIWSSKQNSYVTVEDVHAIPMFNALIESDTETNSNYTKLLESKLPN